MEATSLNPTHLSRLALFPGSSRGTRHSKRQAQSGNRMNVVKAVADMVPSPDCPTGRIYRCHAHQHVGRMLPHYGLRYLWTSNIPPFFRHAVSDLRPRRSSSVLFPFSGPIFLNKTSTHFCSKREKRCDAIVHPPLPSCFFATPLNQGRPGNLSRKASCVNQ